MSSLVHLIQKDNKILVLDGLNYAEYNSYDGSIQLQFDTGRSLNVAGCNGGAEIWEYLTSLVKLRSDDKKAAEDRIAFDLEQNIIAREKSAAAWQTLDEVVKSAKAKFEQAKADAETRAAFAAETDRLNAEKAQPVEEAAA